MARKKEMALDIPLALEQLTRSGRLLASDDWGTHANSNDTYAAFAAGWRGASTVPTLVELQAGYDAAIPANAALQVTASGTAAQAILNSGVDALAKALRAEAAVLVNEINLLRSRLRAQDAAIAAATTLADLKSRWAALAAVPDRTLAQAKTAIVNAIADGTAD